MTAIIGIRIRKGEDGSVLLSPEDTRIIHQVAQQFDQVVLFFHREKIK